MIELKADSEELKQAMKLLSGIPGKFERVRQRALKEAGKIISSSLSHGIIREYQVKLSAVKKAMSIDTGDDEVKITVRDTRHSLKTYNLRPKKAPAKRKTPGYVYGGVKRGNLKRFTRGFIMEHNDLPVMRIGPGKHGSFSGLHVLIGPAISQLADNAEVLPEVEERALKRMDQQLRYWTLRELGLMR